MCLPRQAQENLRPDPRAAESYCMLHSGKQGHLFRGRMLRFWAGNCAMQQWEMLGLCRRQGHIMMDCSGHVREDGGKSEALGDGDDWVQWILGLRGTPEQRRQSSVGKEPTYLCLTNFLLQLLCLSWTWRLSVYGHQDSFS